jgi:hypothetical protein
VAWLQYQNATLAEVLSSLDWSGRELLYASVWAERKFGEDSIRYFYKVQRQRDGVLEAVALSAPAVRSVHDAARAGRVLFSYLDVVRGELPSATGAWESGYALAPDVFLAWSRRQAPAGMHERANQSALGEIRLFVSP